jgi:hypothetical protein
METKELLMKSPPTTFNIEPCADDVFGCEPAQHFVPADLEEVTFSHRLRASNTAANTYYCMTK